MVQKSSALGGGNRYVKKGGTYMRNLRKAFALLMTLALLLGAVSFAGAEGVAYTQSPSLDGLDLPSVEERMPVAAISW